MRNLDRLNELLQPLNIPDFRKKVNDSFGNLSWLQKHIAPKADAELNRLLNMSQRELLQPAS